MEALRDEEIQVIRSMIESYKYDQRHAALTGRLLSRAQVVLAAFLGLAVLTVNVLALVLH